MEGNWRFGKAQGPWTYWHENGTRESSGRFRNGKREGNWAYWDTAGKMRFEGDWADGKLNLEAARASAREHGNK
jgi:antitoxin component YwqK of YwqJK toxin-antitoxin module